MVRAYLREDIPKYRRLRSLASDEIRNFREEYECSPVEINMGMCEDFACRLVERMAFIFGPGAKAYWYDEFEIEGLYGVNHCFVYYDGRFYDAEAPQGVRDYRQLPFFQRLILAGRVFPEFLSNPDVFSLS